MVMYMAVEGTPVYMAPDPVPTNPGVPRPTVTGPEEPGEVRITLQPDPVAAQWADLYARLHRLEGALQAVVALDPEAPQAKVAQDALEQAGK